MNTKEAAIRARQFITEETEGAVNITLPRIEALVPSVLETWTRFCFEDREKRQLLKKRFTANVAGGSLDLTPYLNGSTAKINLKELRETTIYAGASTTYVLNRMAEVVVNITNGSSDLYAEVPFTQADVGRRVFIRDAAVDAIIESFNNGDNVKLSSPASGTVIQEVYVLLFDVITTPGVPFSWLSSQNQLRLPRPVGGDAPACFLDGHILRTRMPNGSLTASAAISFTVTNFPETVEDIPHELEHDFVRTLALSVMPPKEEKSRGNR